MAGWHPDPTGRFGARYHDGTDWTDHVQGADGRVTADPIEARSTPTSTPAPPPPAPAHAPAYGAPAPTPGGWSAAGPVARPPLVKVTGFLGIALAGVGWLLAALSLLLLDWADGTTRGDIADVLPDSLPDGLAFADRISFVYVQWLGLALLVLVFLGLGAALLGLIGRDPTLLRLAVGALAALAAVVHAFAVVRGLRDGIEIGAHVGTVGYLVAAIGLALGSHTRRTA